MRRCTGRSRSPDSGHGWPAAAVAAHSRAARDLAEAYFDSDIVLTGLLRKLGVA